MRMSHTPSPHPEVFEPFDSKPTPGMRVVYPPKLDADGRVDLCELLDWFSLMDQAYSTFTGICTLLRQTIPTKQGETAKRLRECLAAIEVIRPFLVFRNLDLIPHQQRWKDLCPVQFCEAMVWIGDEKCLRMMSECIAGTKDKWLPVSRALVENHLVGQKDWRDAKSPAKWVKTVANTIPR
jgi:hypothetical protein